MIVYRVAVTVHPPEIEAARAMFTRLVTASRAVPGVISFDITQDLANPARFISIEVYQNQAAVDRQGLLPELTQVMAALGHLAAGPPAGRKFVISRSEPWPL